MWNVGHARALTYPMTYPMHVWPLMAPRFRTDKKWFRRVRIELMQWRSHVLFDYGPRFLPLLLYFSSRAWRQSILTSMKTTKAQCFLVSYIRASIIQFTLPLLVGRFSYAASLTSSCLLLSRARETKKMKEEEDEGRRRRNKRRRENATVIYERFARLSWG